MKFRGYIFSRPFMEERVPQQIQNQNIREFCKKQSIIYLLSATEYIMKDSYLMLNQILKEIKNIDGIVFYSLFQLPEDEKKRKTIYEFILLNKKIIYFSIENLSLKEKKDINILENIWNVKQTLKYCPSKISYQVDYYG